MHAQIKKIREEQAKVAVWRSLMKQREILEEEKRDLLIAPIDRILDTFDDEIENNLLQMEQEFFRKFYPEIYHSQKEMEVLYPPLAEFHELLKSGISTITKKRGVFERLLGRHKKAILAHLLHEGEGLARKLLKLSKREDLNTYLQTFIEEVNKPWNHRLYDNKYFALFGQLAEIYEKITLEKMKSGKIPPLSN